MSVELRPLTDDSVYTCDWGRCDEVAVMERRDDSHGWLSVCEHHTGRRNRRQSPGRGPCRSCGTGYTLSVAGRVRLHSVGFDRCPGSGELPADGGAS